MNIKNKLLELENGEKYIVADYIEYMNRIFLMLGKINLNTEEVEELSIYEKIIVDNSETIEIVNDEKLLDKLNNVFKLKFGY